MRIAQRMVTRNYMKSLNTSLSKRAESLDRGTTGLKFKKLSENVADGTRAMRVQEERIRSEAQLKTVESIMLEFNSVDSNLDSIDSVIQTVQEKVLLSMSENYGETARQVLAQEIGSLKGQILQFCNAQFGGKYLFSGTNNATPPFAVNEDNKLTFNGIAMEDIFYDQGKYYYMDGAEQKRVPDSEDIYMDIGLGLRLEDGRPDPRTAFKVSFSGIEIMGFGAEASGELHGTSVSSNVYDLLTQLETAVSNYDIDKMDDMHKQLVNLNDKMRMSRTDLGTRYNFLERTEDRLKNDIDNLSEMESNLVSADPAEEAINMKMYEYVWLATLQLGSKILPTSLLDFI